MSGLRQEYGNQIDFVRFDIDDPDTQDAKEQYGYRYQPHYFLVDRSGQIVDSWLGRVPEETLSKAFDDVLSE